MRKSVSHLSRGVAIYGAGDAAIQVVNLLLLSVYVKLDFLREEDYGAMALILGIEAIMRIVSRWGLDGAFMRHYHDRSEGGLLDRFGSTIIWFTLTADAIVFGVALVLSGVLGSRLFTHAEHLAGLRLMLVNAFLIALTFIPFHLMRLRNEATTYSALVFARSVGTTAVRVALVIGAGWGVAGWFAADLVVTLILLPVLWRWLSPFVGRGFSWEDLRDALRFGLPRLPHGLAQQGLDAGLKFIVSAFVPRATLGVYQNGFTLGAAVRFFTSAFETAWAPFYYATAREANGVTVLAKMATYAIAVMTLIVALTVAVVRDLILVLLTPDYLPAVTVVPIIALGMAFQGVYLLTSIGLNITKRTELYPVATFAALGVGLGSAAVLVPRIGITGAALAFAAAALTQASVAMVLANRFYPISYEVGRIARVMLAGSVAAAAGLWLVPQLSPLAGLLIRAGLTAAVFAAVLALTGFFRPTERAFAAEMIHRWRRRAGGLVRDGSNE